MTEQALALWKSQIPSYQKIINRCCDRILTPLTRFLPTDFQDRQQQLRQALSIRDVQNYEDFLEVILQQIEGVKNKSIIELADILSQRFGGSLKYWQNIILDLAEQVTYTNNFNVWHIRKIFEQRLCIDPQNLSNYRSICKLTKSYLNALNSLIKYIMKFDIKKDSIGKIDDLYKKVKGAQEKYISFSQKIQIFAKSSTLQQLSNNISQKSKQNAIKQLFHFKEYSRQTSKDQEKLKNTLFNYNFKLKNKEIKERVSGPTKNMKQVNKQLVGQKLDQFQQVIKNIKFQHADIQALQSSFSQSKLTQNTSKEKFSLNITTIWDKDYYFSYFYHPIQLKSFSNYITPFAHHQFVNYEINSDDEYQDLIGEDVDNFSQMSSASDVSKNSFVVSDDHLSDQEDVERGQNELKPALSSIFGERWSFIRSGISEKQSKLFSMLLVDSRGKYPLEVAEKSEVEQALHRIVNGKDKAAIMEAVSKQKIKISKAKLKQFLSKKCRVIPSSENPNKTIYKIIESQQQNESHSNEKEEISLKLADKTIFEQKPGQDNQDTMNQIEYFSQPSPKTKMETKMPKRQSQRISNKRQQQLMNMKKRSSNNAGKKN